MILHIDKQIFNIENSGCLLFVKTMGENVRTFEEANKVLNFAKLSRNDTVPTTSTLFFSPNICDTTFSLLELNNTLLKTIENKEKLVIKGCDSDNAVLCTENTTFHLSKGETSNSLLLVKPTISFEQIKKCDQERIQKIEVCDIFHVYLEAHDGKPSLHRLEELLENTEYRGPEHESDINSDDLYTMEELKKIVQISDFELQQELHSLDLFEIGCYVRKLNFEYHFRVLSYMLKLIDENSWSLDTIDYEETCNMLQDIVPEEVIECMFKKYTEQSRFLDGIQMYRYKEAEVCQFHARVILSTAGKFNFDDFMQAWQESVPEGMTPTESMLHGIAIINKQTSPKVIWKFEESSLPDSISERFHTLFEAKEKWTIEEITPYIRRLVSNPQEVNGLLAKYARASKVQQELYFSAKHLN
ncbi:hypothetical protein ABEB36_006247 [Hypothenemus hampei]|uniref:Sister chromatid cohesion protein DCC1 n=1 Tax=Hypothenemus hampei TaxID=57062 RepID=A0ABD1EPW2_HYPHA